MLENVMLDLLFYQFAKRGLDTQRLADFVLSKSFVLITAADIYFFITKGLQVTGLLARLCEPML